MFNFTRVLTHRYTTNRQSNIFTKWLFVSLSRRRYRDWLSSEEAVRTNAQECLESLSMLLGEKRYFYGSRPSTLDAIVYSYLVHFKNIAFQCALSRELLSQFSNLETFVDTVNSEYFADAFHHGSSGGGGDSARTSSQLSFSLRGDNNSGNNHTTTSSKLPPPSFVNRRRKLYMSLIGGSVGAYILYVFRNVIFAPKVVYLRENEPIVWRREDVVIHYDNQSEEHEHEYMIARRQ